MEGGGNLEVLTLDFLFRLTFENLVHTKHGENPQRIILFNENFTAFMLAAVLPQRI
jgi:hypothetical protein